MADDTSESAESPAKPKAKRDGKQSNELMVNSTLTELALMLVFIFALFPAVAVAVNLGGRPPAHTSFAADAPSCFWIPRVDMPQEIGAEVVYFSFEDQSWENSNAELQGDGAGNLRPVPRSFLQIYWLYTPDKAKIEQEHAGHPEPVGLLERLDDERGIAAAIVLNLDSHQKPFLYLRPEARYALRDALALLDSAEYTGNTLHADTGEKIFTMPTHSTINYTTKVLRRSVIFSNSEALQLRQALSHIREMMEIIEERHGCHLRIDFFNQPRGAAWMAHVNADGTDHVLRNQSNTFRAEFGLGDLGSGQPLANWLMRYPGSQTFFPEFVDTTP